MASKFQLSDAAPGLDGVKYIIAIASGKGGVGKSTVAVNLAAALHSTGATVGLLDADIYGPSQVGMLGSKGTEPTIGDNVMHPTRKFGLSFVSMGLLTNDDSPVIWRAPMAMKMIHQFLGGVVWGKLDYLLIDLPPGTGDVQLTLAQQAKLTGAVIVTTPQDIALSVARKGLRMFEQVKVPIIGIIENMSGFICEHCHEETAVFGKGGGRRMAQDIGVPFLGTLPLDPSIMMSGENGVPLVEQASGSPASKAILRIAAAITAQLTSKAAVTGDHPEKYEQDEGGNLQLHWHDGRVDMLDTYYLRVSCPCASCVDEDSGRRTLNPKDVTLDVSMETIRPIGNYALAFDFSDGHNTGIFSWDYLRTLVQASDKSDKKSFSV